MHPTGGCNPQQQIKILLVAAEQSAAMLDSREQDQGIVQLAPAVRAGIALPPCQDPCG